MPEIEVIVVQVPSPRQLKAIRAFLDLSREEFAVKGSISKSAIMDYENGSRGTARATLQAIGLCVKGLEIKFQGDTLTLPE